VFVEHLSGRWLIEDSWSLDIPDSKYSQNRGPKVIAAIHGKDSGANCRDDREDC
jgi:hypothetical protein